MCEAILIVLLPIKQGDAVVGQREKQGVEHLIELQVGFTCLQSAS